MSAFGGKADMADDVAFRPKADRECYTLKNRPIVRGLNMHRHLFLCRLSVALGIVGCAQASVAGATDNDLRQDY
jgi:hypothetical protein